MKTKKKFSNAFKLLGLTGVFLVLIVCFQNCSGLSVSSQLEESHFRIGVSRIDVTPTEPVVLAGSAGLMESDVIESRLFVKAMVISNNSEHIAIVSMDTLKYEDDWVKRAKEAVSIRTGIDEDNILIAATHTHSAPLFYHYEDRLVDKIEEAVSLAIQDVEPCTLGFSSRVVPEISHNRRVFVNGSVFNTFVGYSNTIYPPEGPIDNEVIVLAAKRMSGELKSVLFSYPAHPATNYPENDKVSADYPADVEQYLERELGYKVPTLFLLGPSGNINPKTDGSFQEILAESVFDSLRSLQEISSNTIGVSTDVVTVPGRLAPEFMESDVQLKWPDKVEHYRGSFNSMYLRKQENYELNFMGISFGENFAIVSNPTELFSQISLDIKRNSPFQKTMVSTLTNGNRGYVPTSENFENGAYETWYGEHSFLSVQADQIIKQTSVRLLNGIVEYGRIPNPSFELDIDQNGIPDKWENIGVWGGEREDWRVEVLSSGTNCFVGSQCLLVSSGSAGDNDARVRVESNMFSVNVGKDYEVEFFIKSVGRIEVSIREFDSKGLELRESANMQAIDQSLVEWSLIKLQSFRVSPETAFISVVINVGGTGELSEALLDGFSFKGI